MSLTQARLKELLDYNPETGVFTWKMNKRRPDLAGTPAGRPNTSGHVQIMVDGARYMAHRMAWLWAYNEWPVEVDHRNRAKSDNRIGNLRDGTRAENQHNVTKRSDNSSGFAGVSWNTRASAWHADIQANHKRVHLGVFATPQAASAAYQAAKKIYHPTAPTQ